MIFEELVLSADLIGFFDRMTAAAFRSRLVILRSSKVTEFVYLDSITIPQRELLLRWKTMIVLLLNRSESPLYLSDLCFFFEGAIFDLFVLVYEPLWREGYS